MMVEVHTGLLHVLDEVGDRHYTHQSTGLQVQFLLSDGEEFLCVCRERQNEISFLFQAALADLPRGGALLPGLPWDLPLWVCALEPNSSSCGHCWAYRRV